MANTNIVNVATIAGGSVGYTLTGSWRVLITVTAEYLIKVNSITVANIDGTNGSTCDVKVVKANHTILGITDYDTSGTFYLAKTVEVPPDDILVVLDTPIYLMEGDTLQSLAENSNDLDIFVSFDVIVD